MAGRRPFSELTKGFSGERRARVAVMASTLGSEMELAEIRKALGLRQAEVAERLGVGQSAVAKVESRDDVKVSSLRAHVEAIGGSLRLVASFPDGREVEIKPPAHEDVREYA